MNLVPCVGCLFLNFLLACSTRTCKGSLCRGRNRISILRDLRWELCRSISVETGLVLSVKFRLAGQPRCPAPGRRRRAWPDPARGVAGAPAASRCGLLTRVPPKRARVGRHPVRAFTCSEEQSLQHLWSGVGTRLVYLRSGGGSVTCCLLTPLLCLGRAQHERDGYKSWIGVG